MPCFSLLLTMAYEEFREVSCTFSEMTCGEYIIKFSTNPWHSDYSVEFTFDEADPEQLCSFLRLMEAAPGLDLSPSSSRPLLLQHTSLHGARLST